MYNFETLKTEQILKIPDEQCKVFTTSSIHDVVPGT